MKTGFKDRLKVPSGKKQKSPWDFTAPQYDQRSSCFVSAGDDYGVGVNQPIGHEGNPNFEGVPKGRVGTVKVTSYDRELKQIDLGY